MYNLDLNENEIIIYSNETKILNKGNRVDVAVVITNERLLLLQEVNKLGNLNTVLRQTLALGFVPNKEVIFEAKLDDIKGMVAGEYVKIVFNNNSFIEIGDKNIVSVIESR